MLLEENGSQKAEIAALRAEITRLKGLKGPPNIKPSEMDAKARARTKAKAGCTARSMPSGAFGSMGERWPTLRSISRSSSGSVTLAANAVDGIVSVSVALSSVRRPV